LERSGARTLSLPGDVSDEEAVRGMVEAVMGELGRIDALVNNAGISAILPAEETTLSEWRRVLEVNLTSPFLMSREFGKEMLRAGGGSIVNISSIAGLLGIADRAAYNASKHGLIGLTRTLAAEWGGRGVRVNAVCPGWVRTRMGGSAASRSVEEGADTIVWLATLPPDGPSGGVFRDRERIAW
jgi:NAD(P)-dependent dehydrogenase (short-subunit alcohol dehydrogenase family)